MICALVPARAGSKGFPNKNIATIGGKTLIEYAISAGLESNLIDQVIVSSDSQEYVDIALQCGAVSLGLRPESLANDRAKTIDVILDILERPEMHELSHIVLLQPTSPIRDAELIDKCIELSVGSGESVVTVAKVQDPHPAKMKTIKDGVLRPFLGDGNSEIPRQELPEVYELTGAIYVSSVKNIRENKSLFSTDTVPVVCKDFVNVDSERDFQFLKFLIERGLVSV